MKKLVIVLVLFTLFVKAQVPVMNGINGATVVCSSPSSPTSFSTSASNSPTSYSWSVIPSASVVITNPSASVTPISFPYSLGTYTLYGSATNSVGTSVNTTSFVVNVNETPVAIILGSTTFCQGMSTTLTAYASVISSTPPVIYSWAPSTGLNTTNNASVVANPSAATIYTVTTTKGSCLSKSQITITPSPTPIITVYPPVLYVCPNTTLILNATGASTYTWTNGITNGIPFYYNGNPPYTYTVTGTALNGCVGSSQVQLFQQQLVAIAAFSSSSLLCSGSTATITSQSSSGYSSSIIVSPTVTTSYTFCSPGGYNSWTGQSTCPNCVVFTQSVSACTGINEVATNFNDFTIYPNPFTNQLTINSSTNELKKLIITNLLGQTVYQTEFYQKYFTIGLPQLQSGAYITQLYVSGNFSYRSKLIKE